MDPMSQAAEIQPSDRRPVLSGGAEAQRLIARTVAVDAVGLEERAASLAKRSIKKSSKLWALDLAIRCMDLTTLERLPLWIGGRPTAAHTSRYGEVTNPATGEVIRHVPLGDATDVDTAVKAATEAWARGVAQGFAKSARDAGQPLAAASVIFRAKSLDGLEEALAQRFADLWDSDAADVNDTIVELTDPTL